jgi:hypothetical protein
VEHKNYCEPRCDADEFNVHFVLWRSPDEGGISKLLDIAKSKQPLFILCTLHFLYCIIVIYDEQ